MDLPVGGVGVRPGDAQDAHGVGEDLVGLLERATVDEHLAERQRAERRADDVADGEGGEPAAVEGLDRLVPAPGVEREPAEADLRDRRTLQVAVLQADPQGLAGVLADRGVAELEPRGVEVDEHRLQRLGLAGEARLLDEAACLGGAVDQPLLVEPDPDAHRTGAHPCAAGGHRVVAREQLLDLRQLAQRARVGTHPLVRAGALQQQVDRHVAVAAGDCQPDAMATPDPRSGSFCSGVPTVMRTCVS